MRRLTLTNDYGARYPACDGKGAEVNLDHLPIADEELKADLLAYARTFDEHFSWDEAWDDEEIAAAHKAAGPGLRDRLQAALGSDYEVILEQWEHEPPDEDEDEDQGHRYARIEAERRYLVRRIPDGVTTIFDIADRYLTGTRMRLREVTHADGSVVYKLGHKVREDDGPATILCTNFYLDEAEWGLLLPLPARTLRKTRHIVERDEWRIAVDEHPDGTLVAEIDLGDNPVEETMDVPPWLDVIADVSTDEAWTGAGLAR